MSVQSLTSGSKFVILEKNTGAICTSQRFETYGFDLNGAALFVSRENAEKAARVLGKKPTQIKRNRGHEWSVQYPDGASVHYQKALLKEYIDYVENLYGSETVNDFATWLKSEVTELLPKLEVVEVKMTLMI